MSFWSGEKLKQELPKSKIVTSLEGKVAADTIVVNGAYELSLGPEAFLTSNDDQKKEVLKEGDQIVIPSGQFGLLLTEEKVNIPNQAIGFISIKASIKFRGLINVSGFHVDPGFSGKLKFAVYNAGSQNIVLERKQPIFLLWLSDLDQATKPYSGVHANQDEISPDDVMRIQGEIASPGQLKKEIQKLEVKFDKEIQTLEHKLNNLKLILTAFLTLGVSLLGFALRGYIQRTPDVSQSKTSISVPENSPTNSVERTNTATSQPPSKPN